MEEQDQPFDPRLKDFLEILNLSDDEIVKIHKNTFSALNNDEEKLLIDIMEKNPSVAMAFMLVNMPSEEVSLRNRLLCIMFARFGHGPEHWEDEKTFILKPNEDEDRKGAMLFGEEYEDFCYELVKIANGLSWEHSTLKKALSDLRESFFITISADLIYERLAHSPSGEGLAHFKDKSIVEIRELLKEDRFPTFPDFPGREIVGTKKGTVLYLNFSKMEKEALDKAVKKWEWELVEWLTKVYQVFQNTDLREDIFLSGLEYQNRFLIAKTRSLDDLTRNYPNKVIIRHGTETIKSFPISLLLKQFHLFQKQLKPILSHEARRNETGETGRTSEKGERILEEGLKGADVRARIAETIHNVALKFEPGKWERIQGYYQSAANDQGKTLKSDYANKFSREMMDVIDVVEFETLWNQDRNDIERNMGRGRFETLQKCVDKVIIEKIFDPELPKAAVGTAIGDYIDFLEVRMRGKEISLDSQVEDEKEDREDENKDPTLLDAIHADEPAEGLEGDFDKLMKDQRKSKIKTEFNKVLQGLKPKERKIVTYLMAQYDENQRFNLAEAARQFGMTRQGISQLIKRISKKSRS